MNGPRSARLVHNSRSKFKKKYFGPCIQPLCRSILEETYLVKTPKTLLLPPEALQVVAEGPNLDIQSFFEQNKK